MAMTDSVLLWILLMVWLVPFALFILLQIFLCRKENKWLGLILPAISFLGSLVFLLQATNVRAMVLSFLVSNIGTVVYLLIYAAIRRKKKKNSDMDQMKIKDLKKKKESFCGLFFCENKKDRTDTCSVFDIIRITVFPLLPSIHG